MYVTSNESLAERDSGYCRDLIKSDWFRSFWPYIYIKKDHDQKLSFENSYGGYRISYGVNSGFTGQGADIICCDDLNDPREVYSDVIREGINKTFDEKISNRFNDPKKGRIINIQQRLHESDLTGHILESENKDRWESLILPMEYEGKRFISSFGFEDPRKEIGKLLWPARFGPDEAAKAKADGELYWSQQYQQRPTPVTGNVFRESYFEPRVDNKDIIARWISCDTSQSVRLTADPNAIIVGELTSKYQLFIRYVSNKRLEFPDLQAEVERIANLYKYKLQGIIIESKSSGISLQQSIKASSPDWMRPLIMPWEPRGEKIQRFYQAAMWCERGCILLPPPNENYPWLFDFEEELFKVPNTKHDDQADALSQLITVVQNALARGLREKKQKEV